MIIKGTAAAETLKGNKWNNTLYGFKGNDILNGGRSNDTVSYANSTKGVIANLDTGVCFTSSHGTTLKIMPLGDSITLWKS